MNEPVLSKSAAPAAMPKEVPVRAWEPPAIVWEHPFVALAQVSEPPCIPGQDPRCTP
ncbi:MAG: hypothetical protein K1X64_18870 [Myxococcaceae bacterium]|nr:hypothetical protein [Myxococcaceae bacterium]